MLFSHSPTTSPSRTRYSLLPTPYSLTPHIQGDLQMSMFFDVLSAINNPSQQGSVSQLADIMNSVQSLTLQSGIQQHQLQTMVSVVGNAIRPVLQQQQTNIGSGRLDNLIGEVITAGGTGSTFQSLFSPQLMQQMSETVAQQTGMSPNVAQNALPTVITAVLSIFRMGTHQTAAWGNSNPLLSSFLDSNRDGATDLSDVMKFANRFLNPPAA
jgi:hypothetical protein